MKREKELGEYQDKIARQKALQDREERNRLKEEVNITEVKL
jgi:hypothetical protein